MIQLEFELRCAQFEESKSMKRFPITGTHTSLNANANEMKKEKGNCADRRRKSKKSNHKNDQENEQT